MTQLTALASELRRTAEDAVAAFETSLRSQGLGDTQVSDSVQQLRDISTSVVADQMAAVGARGAEVVAAAVKTCMQVRRGSGFGFVS